LYHSATNKQIALTLRFICLFVAIAVQAAEDRCIENGLAEVEGFKCEA
jgi:hypothetical protein